MIKKILLTATIELEILNEENFDDFGTAEKTQYLVQELLDESTWPGEGIGCTVIGVNTQDMGTVED